MHFIKMLSSLRAAHAVLDPQFYKVIFRLSPLLISKLVPSRSNTAFQFMSKQKKMANYENE